MKIIALIFAIISLVLIAPTQASTMIGDLQFEDNIDSLMARAQQSQKYVVIDWFTDW